MFNFFFFFIFLVGKVFGMSIQLVIAVAIFAALLSGPSNSLISAKNIVLIFIILWFKGQSDNQNKNKNKNKEKNKINPFAGESDLDSVIRCAELAVGTVLLLPLRLCLLILGFGICCLFAILLSFNQNLKSLLNPTLTLIYCSGCHLGMRCSIRLIAFSVGVWWIETKGEPVNVTKAPIIVANHSGFVDSIILFYYYLPSAVIAARYSTWPIIGRIATALNAIPVDRQLKESRGNVAQEIKCRVNTYFSDLSNSEATYNNTTTNNITFNNPLFVNYSPKSQILLYPEETTTNSQSLIEFKLGAFLPGVPVQACVINFPTWQPSWVHGGPNIFGLIFRLFSSFWTRVQINFLPPIQSIPPIENKEKIENSSTINQQVNVEKEKKEETQRNIYVAHMFADDVQKKMSKASGLPITRHTFDDVLLQDKAFKLGIDPLDAVIEFGKVLEMFERANPSLTISQQKEKCAQYCHDILTHFAYLVQSSQSVNKNRLTFEYQKGISLELKKGLWEYILHITRNENDNTLEPLSSAEFIIAGMSYICADNTQRNFYNEIICRNIKDPLPDIKKLFLGLNY